ncbi:MAG: hypothetical protein P8Y44_06855, partial [Acidobacteriota bacterium]
LQADPLGPLEKAVQGDAFFTAPNPPFGAVFTYHLAQTLEERRESRRGRESELRELGEPVYYPEWEQLRAEDREREPRVELVVTDRDDRIVRRLAGPVEAGFHRVAWDLRYAPMKPVISLDEKDRAPWDQPAVGPMAAPGEYSVRLVKIVDGKLSEMGESRSFEAQPLAIASLGAEDRLELLEFQQGVAALQRAVMGINELAEKRSVEIDLLYKALVFGSEGSAEQLERLEELRSSLIDLRGALQGDQTISKRSEPTLPGIVSRVERVVGGFWSSSAPTSTHRRSFEVASQQFDQLYGKFRQFEADFEQLQADVDASGVPWTPGRGLPDWR